MHIYYLSKISLYIPSPTFLSSFTSPKEGVTKYLKPSGNLKPEARPNERNLRRKRTDGRNRASHRSIAPLPRLRPPSHARARARALTPASVDASIT